MIIAPDQISLKRLRHAAKELGRTVEDLATSAVEEMALDWAKERGFPEEKEPQMTKRIKFQGYSDDTFGCDEVDHDNCANGNPIVFLVLDEAEEEGLYVVGQYSPKPVDGWLIGVSPYDEHHVDKPMPEWPIALGRGDEPYSPALTIDVPDGATIRLVHGTGEREGSHPARQHITEDQTAKHPLHDQIQTEPTEGIEE